MIAVIDYGAGNIHSVARALTKVGATVELTARPEKIAEAETYITYCGTYEFYEDRVVHNIEMALFPNRVGSSQVRYYRIKGSRIILTTPPISIDNKPQVCTVIWERPSSQ